MKIFVALYDRATEAYGVPILTNTPGEAIRSFRDEVNSRESPINKHPTDYELWKLGTYNEQTGQLTPDLEKLARAEDHKE